MGKKSFINGKNMDLVIFYQKPAIELEKCKYQRHENSFYYTFMIRFR